MTPKAREFFEALLELCDKHDASIGGCGCCGSPHVTIGADGFDMVKVSPSGVNIEIPSTEIKPKGPTCPGCGRSQDGMCVECCAEDICKALDEHEEAVALKAARKDLA